MSFQSFALELVLKETNQKKFFEGISCEYVAMIENRLEMILPSGEVDNLRKMKFVPILYYPGIMQFVLGNSEYTEKIETELKDLFNKPSMKLDQVNLKITANSNDSVYFDNAYDGRFRDLNIDESTLIELDNTQSSLLKEIFVKNMKYLYQVNNQFYKLIINNIDLIACSGITTTGSSPFLAGWSVDTYPGRVAVIVSANDIFSNMIELYLHESIHTFLYKLEYLGSSWVEGDLRSYSKVCSPWSGRELSINTFLHAVFVWRALLNFSENSNIPLSIDIHKIKHGFRSVERLLMHVPLTNDARYAINIINDSIKD